MQFALLTNQVREARRPPLFVQPVDAALLSRMFSAVKKTALGDSRAGKTRPARQPHNPNNTPVQIPIEVFSSKDRSAATGQAINNGKGGSHPLNSNPILPVQPRIKPATVRVSKNNLVWPSGLSRKNLENATSPPSIPIPRGQPPDPRNVSQTSLPVHQPVAPVQPPGLVSRPAAPAPPPGHDSLSAARSALALHRFMERHPDLPRQSILLGACDDGWPLMLNLFDPSVGALLAISDERESQLDLLRNVIDSAATRNSPRKLQFLVISHQPQRWRSWVDERGFTRHCLGVVGAEEESVPVWVLRLADWTDQRRLGKISGPPILLVMDSLSFLSRLTSDVRQNFEWMVREGPPALIWPLGTISTELASSLGASTLSLFQSHVLGLSKDPQVYAQLVGLNEQEMASFDGPRQFAVRVGQRLIQFQLPA